MLGLGVVSKLWNDADLRNSVEELVSKTVKAEVALVQNSAELSYRLMRYGLEAGLPRREGDRATTHATAEVVKDLINVNVGYYSTLVDLNLAFTDRLLKALATDSPRASAEPAPAAAPLRMNLVARVGDRLRVPFRVENNQAEATTVSFHLTPFTPAGQDRSIASEASFDPPDITLDPYQEVQIFLVLPVTPIFEPPGTYNATLAVKGMAGMKIQVCLEVNAEG
ncbi:MAG: hypothetical protein ACFCVB_22045 [Nodosilinea sp.]